MDGFHLLGEAVGHLLSGLRNGQVLGSLTWLLCFVFVWSGLAKVQKPILAAGAIADFGLTKRIVPAIGIAAGAVEIVVGVGLLALPFGHWLAAIAMWLFTILVSKSLIAGRNHACYCFGDPTTSISPWTLLRTVALALLASSLALEHPAMAFTHPDGALQAVAGAAIFGLFGLLSYVPRLTQWTSEYAQNVRSGGA